MIDRLVADLFRTSEEEVRSRGIGTLQEVRATRLWLKHLSPEVATENRRLKRPLTARLSPHPRIERMRDKSRRILIALFERYVENPRLLPESFRRRHTEERVERLAADYI